MNCTGTICQCFSTEYFDSLTLLCKPKTLNNTSCASDITCRSDLGLSCQSALCQCNYTSQFWSALYGQCINYLTYLNNCSTTNECEPNGRMLCLTGKCKFL